MTSDLPLVLTVPGLNNSGPDHWQTRWEALHNGCLRVNLGHWNRPHRNSWVNQLNLALRTVEGPVLLAAHSLGCHAVAAWAQMEPEAAHFVKGALLVAPPEVDFSPLDDRISVFSPTPAIRLPFPTLLMASSNDPYCPQPVARRMARQWGADFIDAGPLGHINAASGLGDWDEGWQILLQLAGKAEGSQPAGRAWQPRPSV